MNFVLSKLNRWHWKNNSPQKVVLKKITPQGSWSRKYGNRPVQSMSLDFLEPSHLPLTCSIKDWKCTKSWNVHSTLTLRQGVTRNQTVPALIIRIHSIHLWTCRVFSAWFVKGVHKVCSFIMTTRGRLVLVFAKLVSTSRPGACVMCEITSAWLDTICGDDVQEPAHASMLSTTVAGNKNFERRSEPGSSS